MSSAIAQQRAPSETVGQFLSRTKKMLIGGEWTDSASSAEIAVYDPATEEQITTVPDANAADVERAVAAAREALESGPWPQMLPEEIFGPVLVAQRFDDIDGIAAAANDSPYGLAASIWSNDLRAVHRLVPKIKAGTVWVNCHGMADPNLPFGGYKQSGFGREHGRSAIDMYTEIKSVWMAL